MCKLDYIFVHDILSENVLAKVKLLSPVTCLLPLQVSKEEQIIITTSKDCCIKQLCIVSNSHDILHQVTCGSVPLAVTCEIETGFVYVGTNSGDIYAYHPPSTTFEKTEIMVL